MPRTRKTRPVLLALGVLAAAMLGQIAPARAQAPAVGAVEALIGAATVTRLNESAPRALAVGEELFEGDRIHTEAGARVRLRLLDDSVLTCGEATDLTLDRVLYAPRQDTRNVLLRVPLGIVRAVVGLLVPQSRVEMHTATAVISARGTEWITEAQPAATATVALEGEVAVRNVDAAVPGAVSLGPGDGVTVEAGAPPPAPTVWGDARRFAFIQRTTVP
jgi:hypothetical protein